jgi:hypothetical protein
MALLISVAPVGEGWAVSSEALENDLTFDGGARAEAAARALAKRYAEDGMLAEVQIYLRDGVLAGRFVHTPRETGVAYAR